MKRSTRVEYWSLRWLKVRWKRNLRKSAANLSQNISRRFNFRRGRKGRARVEIEIDEERQREKERENAYRWRAHPFSTTRKGGKERKKENGTSWQGLGLCPLRDDRERNAEQSPSRVTDTKVGHSAKGVSPRAMTTAKLETTSSDLASGHFPAIDPWSVTTKLPHVRLYVSWI